MQRSKVLNMNSGPPLPLSLYRLHDNPRPPPRPNAPFPSSDQVLTSVDDEEPVLAYIEADQQCRGQSTIGKQDIVDHGCVDPKDPIVFQ